MNQELSRRRMIGTGLAALATASLGNASFAADEVLALDPARDTWKGLKIGVASYTLRKLNLPDCAKAIRKTGLHYVSIKDMHLALNSTTEQRKAAVAQFKEFGITPISCGVVSMKNEEASVRQAFEYARDCGMPTIVASPSVDSLPLVEKMVKEFDIRIAIHNHGPEDKLWPSPLDIMKGVANLDPRIGVCIDVGHTARAQVDPASAVLQCKDRLFDMHLKDIANTQPRGFPVEVGRGVLDIRSIMAALLKIQYKHHVGFEYEKDADDPLMGLAESVGYVRGIMASL